MANILAAEHPTPALQMLDSQRGVGGGKFKFCRSWAHLHKVIAQGRTRVVLEGLADAKLPLTAALVPTHPVARLQLGVQGAHGLLVPHLNLGTHPTRESPKKALSVYPRAPSQPPTLGKAGLFLWEDSSVFALIFIWQDGAPESGAPTCVVNNP